MNIFVLRTLLPHVSTGTIYRGVTPFVIADVVRLAILISLPVLSTWLPTVLFR
jgi:TRAP-type mannitol/chloroaromatic compound transport system permease large subunit